MKANEFRCSCCNKVKDTEGQEERRWDRYATYHNQITVTVCKECAKKTKNKSVMEVVK